MGALGYLIFANVPFLVPIGDYCGPRLVSLMPVVLFIFPAMFLLLLGPVILQAMKMMR